MADKEKLSKNDFIEIDFTGKIKETGEIFDTTMQEDAKKANFDVKNLKPYILSIGNSMLIKGLDKELEGKEVGEKYTLSFSPEESFGKRNPQLVRMIPLRIFTEQRIMPQKGMQLTLDGMLVKVVSVTGGRVLADFNNPLSGKAVSYEVKINRKVSDIKEKIDSLQDFFFKKIFSFDFNDKDKKVVFKVPESDLQMQALVKFYAKPFKDILDLDIELGKEEKKDKAEEKKS